MEKRSVKNFGRRMLSLVLALVMCVSLLNLTALAAEGEAGPGTGALTCGKKETEGHTHTEDCYGMVEKLTCGQEETEGHSHSEACYTEEPGTLTCEEEHEHSEECYGDPVKTLTCGKEETAAHTHSAECYTAERALTCGQEEAEAHTHTADCYKETKNEDEIGGDTGAGDPDEPDMGEPAGDPGMDGPGFDEPDMGEYGIMPLANSKYVFQIISGEGPKKCATWDEVLKSLKNDCTITLLSNLEEEITFDNTDKCKFQFGIYGINRNINVKNCEVTFRAKKNATGLGVIHVYDGGKVISDKCGEMIHNHVVGKDAVTLNDNKTYVEKYDGQYVYNVTLDPGAYVSMETKDIAGMGKQGVASPYMNLTLNGLNSFAGDEWCLVKGVSSDLDKAKLHLEITLPDGFDLEIRNTEDYLMGLFGDLYLINNSTRKEPETVDLGVFLDGVDGSDENDGSYGTPVKTFGKASELVAKSAVKTIYIKNTVTVDGEETWDLPAGFTVSRLPTQLKRTEMVWDDNGQRVSKTFTQDAERFLGDLVKVTSTGSLTLQRITLDGGIVGQLSSVTDYETGALVRVVGGTLNIKDGALLTRNTKYTSRIYVGTENISAAFAGGAVYAENGATVNMTGGKVSQCWANYGGGIAIRGSAFNMSGGEIIDNQARQLGAQTNSTGHTGYERVAGGGVYLGYGSTMRMTGGKINSNDSDWFGGGIAVGGADSGAVEKTSTLTMTGGNVDSNFSSHSGGGIFVEHNCEADISGSPLAPTSICGNKSNAGNFSGGGIYVNGGSMPGLKNGLLKLTNVEIANNQSGGAGTAVAGCPTSNVKIYLTDGAVIHDNHNKEGARGVDVYTSSINAGGEGGHSGYAPATVSDFMLGGGRYHWTDKNDKPYEINDNGSVALGYGNEYFLKTAVTADDFDVKAGMALAGVKINGNTAQDHGGAIGTNGDVTIGTEDYSALWLEKQVDGEEAGEHRDDTFNFTVTFEDFTGSIQAKRDGQAAELVELSSGPYNVSLKDGEHVLLFNIPVDTKFTIVETVTNDASSTTVERSDETSKEEVVLTDDTDHTTTRTHYSSTTSTGVTVSGTILPAGFATVVVYTNTFNPPPPPPGPSSTYTSLSVTKVWADEGHEEERPSSVEVQLYRDGQPYGGTVTLSEAGGWSHEWTRLDDDYTWTVDEVNAPEGYTVSVSGSGTSYTITNTYDNPPPPPDDDIPDDDIPLNDLPDMDIPLTELPEEEIPDEDIPLDDVPQTGDSSRMALWLALMAGSGMGMAVLGIQSKKQEEEQ